MGLKQQIKIQDTKVDCGALSRSFFRPQGKSKAKSAVAMVSLTSLVDCFTILITYLLMATHVGGNEMQVPRGVDVPSASSAHFYELGVTVSYANGKYLIDNKIVPLEQLTDKLDANTEEKKKFLNIVADQKAQFEDLNSAVLAGMQAGFKEIRFVVKQEDEG